MSSIGKSTLRGNVLLSVLGIGFGFFIGASSFLYKGHHDLIYYGRVCAMAGAYLSLIALVFASRIPTIEREIGHDKMLLLHRSIGPSAVLLIFLHATFTTLGYAKLSRNNFYTQTLDFINSYPWLPQAIIAEILMVLLAIISYKKIRNKMKYEFWWLLHLLFYVAVILAFGHEILNGSTMKMDFVRFCWVLLYSWVFFIIIKYRIYRPIKFSVKHSLKVSAVVKETDNIYSIYIRGRNLQDLDAHGGQFFQWRFLTGNLWWQAHPYSLSSSPRDGRLRITVKTHGDYTEKMVKSIRPGTKIFAEGPYGVFVAPKRESNLIAAFAAGIGITPILAVLKELPRRCNVIVIYRASKIEEVSLYEELNSLCERNGWKIYYLIGSRQEHPINLQNVYRYIPDLEKRDVYVCGPEEFIQAVNTLAIKADVPHNRIYHESFSF